MPTRCEPSRRCLPIKCTFSRGAGAPARLWDPAPRYRDARESSEIRPPLPDAGARQLKLRREHRPSANRHATNSATRMLRFACAAMSPRIHLVSASRTRTTLFCGSGVKRRSDSGPHTESSGASDYAHPEFTRSLAPQRELFLVPPSDSSGTCIPGSTETSHPNFPIGGG